MRKTIHFIALIAYIYLCVSCEKEEIAPTGGVSGYFANVKINNGILSFDNEKDFQDLLKKVRYEGEYSGEKKIFARNIKYLNNFESLLNEYYKALDDAESYYEREGGYQEFKTKYSHLYFPEYKDDYSVYLPVSDKALAKLLSKEGKVIIGGEEKDMRDIFSYEQLKKLGLAIPDIDNTETEINIVDDISFPQHINSPLRTKKGFNPLEDLYFSRIDEYITDRYNKSFPYYSKNKKIKLWISAEITSYVVHRIKYEINFRKKGFLGIWYNSSFTTTFWYEVMLNYQKEPLPKGVVLTDDAPKYYKINKKEKTLYKYSPHVDYFTVTGFPTQYAQGAYYTPYYHGVMYFKHSGFGNTQFAILFNKYTIDPSGRFSNDPHNPFGVNYRE